MSIFSDTILKSIADYRLLLRRYLSQPDRIKKLTALDLRRSCSEDSPSVLYETGYRIVKDIQSNLNNHGTGYYAYSGTRKFAEYLANFLSEYDVVDDEVIHKVQQACRAILLSIQLVDLPSDKLGVESRHKFRRCSRMVAFYATAEQKENYLSVIQAMQGNQPDLYESVKNDFDYFITQQSDVQSAA